MTLEEGRQEGQSRRKPDFEDVAFLAFKMEEWVTSQRTQVGLESGKGLEIMIF